MRAETLVLLGILDAACGAVDELAALLAEAFRPHPDHTIITSFTGSGRQGRDRARRDQR